LLPTCSLILSLSTTEFITLPWMISTVVIKSHYD
jgi:hypothetical protein